MQRQHQPIYFLSAKRSPFGSFLGSLAAFSATDLGVIAARASLHAADVRPEQIDHVVFGNVLQTSKDAIYLARHIGLRCEIPSTTPALTVNRLCGSGFEAIIQGARLINSLEADCVLVGGTESMSQAPHVIRGARRGLALGQGRMEDSLFECLTDTYVNLPMGMTAENLGQIYNLSQDAVDEYSVLSHERYQTAFSKNLFDDEIEAVDLNRKSEKLSADEHPRKNVHIDNLRKLPKVFKPDGLIHAGAASGICDGAAALIMCSEKFLSKIKRKPLGELISFGITGCDPKIMGIGPVLAIKKCLSNVDVNLKDVAMIEVNEAFAPQVLAVQKELNLDIDKFNMHGGAIALGHPLAASGARIATHLLHSLKHEPQSLGLGSACIGGGQGIAILVKAI